MILPVNDKSPDLTVRGRTDPLNGVGPPPFPCRHRLAASVIGALLGACTATTTVTLSPPDQAPICQPQAGLRASVLWKTDWRPNQKDVPEREAAAAQGMADFFAGTTCFRSTAVAKARPAPQGADVPDGSDLLLVLTVRELGPTVRLLSSAALVDGATEVVIDVAQYKPGRSEPDRQFSIHWRNGGPGVVKGVQSLPSDIAAALRAGLQAR